MGNTVKLSDLGGAIKKYWYLLLLCCLLGTGGAFVASKKIVETVYYATTDLLAHKVTDDKNINLQADINANILYVNTYKDLITSQAVLNEVRESVAEKFDLNYSHTEILEKMEVVQTKDSQLFRIIGQGATGELAEFISNKTTDVFLKKAEEMKIDGGLEVVARATEATEDENISAKLLLLLGFVCGGGIGIVVILLKYFSTSNHH